MRKTLVRVCAALVTLLMGARSGAGRRSRAARYRVLPAPGRAHSRENRLRRFLANPRREGRAVSTGLGRLLLARSGQGFYPVLIDQTRIGSVETLIAAVPCEGRALPLAVYTFAYPWREVVPSQNRLEDIVLGEVRASLPRGDRACLRRRPRLRVLERCLHDGTGSCCGGGRAPSSSPRAAGYSWASCPCGPARPCGTPTCSTTRTGGSRSTWWSITIFAAPWYLLVPCWTRPAWTSAEVVRTYRRRMQIEQSFRDVKTHLGVRGLQLKVRVAERLGRLLLAVCLAYALLVLLGATPAGHQARRDLEVLRRQPRPGTRRTLSVLTVAMIMLSHPRHALRALQAVARLLRRWARMRSTYRLPPFSFRRALPPPPRK